MPDIEFDIYDREDLYDQMEEKYKEDQARTGIHVSDLLLCMRQSILSREYSSIWEAVTLLRFTLGRALEKAAFSFLLSHKATQELEVIHEDIEGHIDFGVEDIPETQDLYGDLVPSAGGLDYECKFTWSKLNDDPQEFMKKKWYWLEQAGAYTYMRERLQMRFLIFHLLPLPSLQIYLVTWTQEELDDLWAGLQARKVYFLQILFERKVEHKDVLPPLTQHKWLCNGCNMLWICKKKELEGI